MIVRRTPKNQETDDEQAGLIDRLRKSEMTYLMTVTKNDNGSYKFKSTLHAKEDHSLTDKSDEAVAHDIKYMILIDTIYKDLAKMILDNNVFMEKKYGTPVIGDEELFEQIQNTREDFHEALEDSYSQFFEVTYESRD